MKKCPACGHMLAESFKFCCDCGFKLPVQSQVCTSGNCQVTTAEHQTSVVSEAEPQHENEPLTLSVNKTDTPLKHSSEDPMGNVKKKSEDSPSNTELTTDTHQKEESSGSESCAAVDVPPTGTPPKNTATPAATPTVPSKLPTSLIPSPYQTTTEDQPEGPSKVNESEPLDESNTSQTQPSSVKQDLPEKTASSTHETTDQNTGPASVPTQPVRQLSYKEALMGETTETRTVTRKQSVENQDKRLPSKHKEPEKQSDYGGGDASKSSTADSPPAKEDSPPNHSNDEDFQQVESPKNKDKQKKPTQMSPEGSKEAGVMNEQQTSSNQSDKCTKDEANSQPCVDQSQVSTDDPTDKSNTSQEETKNENTEKQSQPPQFPTKVHHGPGKDNLTIYFHAVVSKRFKLDPSKDIVCLRSGSLFETWDTNGLKMEITGNLGENGFLVEGQMVTPKKNVGVSIPYKYVVCKRKDNSYEYKYEHIYLKDAKQHVNRCLFVKEDLLTHDGNWHQYDDIIRIEPDQSWISRFKNKFAWWDVYKEKVVTGRQLAGKVMLGNMFNLLQTWSEVNIRNFFTQLQQFFTNYKSPFLHVDGPKKWDLPYGEEQVDLLSYFEELSLSNQMTLDEFMEVHRLDGLTSDVTGEVTYFNLCNATSQMAFKLNVVRESFIFAKCLEYQAKELSHKHIDTDEIEVYTLDVIHSKIFQGCYDNYKRIYESLKSGTLSLEDVDSIFEVYKDKYDEMKNDLEIMCRINLSDDQRWIRRRIKQIQQYHDLHQALDSAKVIMDVRETICPQGDFKVLQSLLDSNADFKEKSLNHINDNLMETKKVLEDITEPRRLCLQELGLWGNFVKWVKEALEDINELKVFVDLASISAGENDLDVDRVACFHDAVLGYSSMLYGLPKNADFNAFKEALTKLWKALGSDRNIPNKLRDTARHLDWLKTVKDSHGSVELSSLSLATSINTRGIYVIGAHNQKKLSLDTALKLQVPDQQGEGQMRNYSLEDLRDLQNKLMLMSGKGEQSQSEVDHFTEVFDSVQRLAVAFVDLYAAGNPLFRVWEAKIHCNMESDTGVTMDFNLGNILRKIMVEGNAVKQLTDLCRKIEMCLDDWNRFMDKQRSQHYYLNYFTAEQIVYLCNVLTENNLNNKLEENVLMMLSFIKPDCSVSEVDRKCTIDEQEEEEELLETSENTVSRKLPKGFFTGQPNLIICPQDKILTVSVCLYMTSEDEQLPTYDEVLLCTPATSYEQVELFFRRCLTPGYMGEKIYALLFADQLSYEVSYAVEKFFQKLSSCFRSSYRLVIICSAEREHNYIPSAFSHFKRDIVPQESPGRIQKYLSRHYTVPSHQASAASVFIGRHFVGIVSSKRAGVGKSLYIQRLYDKLEGTMRIGTTFHKCIRLIEPKVDEHIILRSLFDTPEKKEHKIFHFDVTSSVQKGLHEFLFKLFFLRYLADSDALMWKCSSKDLYIIETLQSTHELPRSDPMGHVPLFEVFPKVFCRPPKEVMWLEMRNGDDPELKSEDPLMDDQCFRSEAFQRPYQYLTRFHRGENLDSFTYQRVEGTHAECLQMLFIYCGISDPSWAELRNFAWFLNLQLLDCETSAFCNFQFIGDTLRGFRNFVVDFMILMAKDFATPSLCITDQSHGRQQMDLNGLNERDLAPFLIRKRWESEPHPYIFFNDDHASMTFIGFHLRENKKNGVDAINPSTNVVIKRNIMTKDLYNGLRRQRVPFNIDFDQLSRADKIVRLCSVLGIKWPTDPDETYELTTDNILKMMAIHMRFRCGIPVIIMGETGCGKTRLIKFLCELRRSGAPTENMKLVKVHGGTTSDMIYTKVHEAEAVAVANKEKHGFDSVLFLDEANTTEAISSIKEILCDNTVQGQQLGYQTGLQIIAACNPYRKHTDEMIKRLEKAGLGYRVRAEETEERLGSIPLRQLVYRVQVLPPSMIPLVWDFGQLNDHTEKMYIQQIVQRVVGKNSIKRVSIKLITDVLSSSQRFMRQRKDECSFVSLRDVERCMQVFVWFYKNHSMFSEELRSLFQKQPRGERNRCDQVPPPASDPVDWSLLMAVGVCYQACLETKGEYQKEICKFFPRVLPQKMKQEISLMQDLLLSGVPMGETIARNKALKENVFMMVICIELRIPLFLVGKPGSSKSLSKTLVADAMQGQAAHSELYKRLKQIHLVSFQCSPHSTPEGIINTFKQCARFQESKNLEEYISVVVLDEIGLAEDSPKMPLKTLHPLLEEGCIDDEPLPHKRVGFIGISNWALDPAKMNRGLFVSRGDPDQNELFESAKGICSSDKMILEKVKHLFKPFAKAYMKTCKKGKGFFGLRDYYSLVKMMFAITKISKQSPGVNQIIEAVLRNFSGRDDVDAVYIFTKQLWGKSNKPDLDGISTIDLVKQNIIPICQDEECRYLLVLTKNYAALQILQQTFFSDQSHPEIIFGSSFPKDQEYTQICRNINRVKICMETGQTVVLLNLQNLYESLYDALNQYYVSLGGQKYVDLGLGTHRVKCRVHKNFRLIVIEDKEVVYTQFPIPLINRLEKHYLDINTVLKNEGKEIVKQLQEWVKVFVSLKSQQSKTNRYLPTDVFIGYHSDTCSSVVLQVTEKKKDESDISDPQRRALDEAKFIMLNCATPDSVIRLDGTKLSDVEIEKLTQIYFEEQKHKSLADFIASHTQLEEWCHAHFTEVTTFSRQLTAGDIKQLQNITELCNIKLLSLQQFDTEHSFLKEIRQFLDSTSADKVLIIQTDYDEASQSMNILASAKYSSINEINKPKANGGNGRVFVYFVTKLPRIEGGTSYVGFHGGPWKSVHIDDLRRSKEFVSDVQFLRNLPISQLFEDMKEPCYEHSVSIIMVFDEAMQPDTDTDFQPPAPEHSVSIIMVFDEAMQPDTDTDFQPPAPEHSGSIMAVFEVTDLVRSCVQSAVSMLRDQEDSGALSTRRVEILLTLMEDSEDLKAVFLKTLRSRLHSLLESHERNIPSPKYWVLTEASNINALQEGGTFTQTLWKKIQAVVTPVLAQLVSVIDRDCNLDLLLDVNCGEEVKKLWLEIFGNNEMLDIPLVKVDSNSESKTILVQSHITAERTMRSSMPFSWRIRDILDELMMQTQQTCINFTFFSEGHSPRQFEEFFPKIPLGQYMATMNEKMQREFFQRYLQDFIAMTMKVSSAGELKLLCDALNSCVNELRRRRKAPSEEIPSIPLIHSAYHMYRTRLQNLSRMMSLQPQVALHLQRNPQVKDSPVMVGSEIFHTLLHLVMDIQNLMVLPYVVSLRFDLQCPVCMGEPEDPVDLPCHHIFCLTCVRRRVNVGQMYCPMCKQELPDDFEVKVSEDVRWVASITLNGHFRRSCSAFFINLVTTVCFKDNIPPSKGVILQLLSFLMRRLWDAAQSQIHTKDFSPFDESLDKNPVVRSVILKLLLKYSFDEVKEYLQQHLTSIEESNIVDAEDKNELYALYINCLEDSLLERMPQENTCLQEETEFLHHFLDSVTDSAETVTIEYLQQIARVRLCLGKAAHLLHSIPQDVVEEFLRAVRNLCERSVNDWYRVYLIRNISRQQGVECVQGMLKEAEYRWLFPEEIHQQNEDGGQMDQYLVYGEQYLAVREAVAKAVLEGTVEDIEKKFHTQRLYLTIMAVLPQKCQELEYFIQGSRYLDPKPVRDFAMALVQNRMGELNVHNGRTGAEHVLIELAVHLAAVLLTGTEGVLTPLQQLACPEGHPCAVGECGRPTQLARCLECGAVVGGKNHAPVRGFNLTRTGHILGDPQRRDNPDSQDTKNMSLTPFTLVRLLTHLAMLLGASEHPQVRLLQIIQPPVADPCGFLILHLLKDMDHVTKALGKGTDGTVTAIHLIIRSILDSYLMDSLFLGMAGYDSQLSTKEARNTWETTVATDIITPQLKHLDQRLREVNATIRNDLRVSSNFIMRVTFGDECPLSSLPRGSQVHCSGVWSCRERVSLLSLTHIVEQNDGKDKLPLLWRFLQKEAEFRLVRFLPDILALQKSLVKRFQRSSDLMNASIREFIQKQSGNHSYHHIIIFLNTWNLLRLSVATSELPFFDYSPLDLQYLLPRRQGPGLCSTALLSHLVALHNELLHAVDRHTGEDTSYKVSLSELTDLHVIRYEVEKDLLPLVLSNCQYSLERGKETLSEYDLPKIQQQVLTRFLQGKPLITLTGIPILVTRHERDYESILKTVKGKVSQERLPSLTLTALSRDLESYSEVCDALKAVELALGFLSMTGGDTHMPLVRYLEDTLRMSEQTEPHFLKALGRCSLKHCVALWQLLSSLKSENMLKSLKRDPFFGVSAEYQKHLEEEQKKLLQGFITVGNINTWLLEMHEFLLLNLGSPRASDTYGPHWR
uniref:RING-type E3 ubiquitin transferase n=1 Tax=Oncorhynchus tshawytscha TaxID=74940 RepID=A0A8C8MEV5_ONCTS